MRSGFIILPSQCRAARELLGIKQEDLSNKSGVTRSTIGDFERGARNLRMDTMQKLSDAFVACGIQFISDGSKVGVVLDSDV